MLTRVYQVNKQLFRLWIYCTLFHLERGFKFYSSVRFITEKTKFEESNSHDSDDILANMNETNMYT